MRMTEMTATMPVTVMTDAMINMYGGSSTMFRIRFLKRSHDSMKTNYIVVYRPVTFNVGTECTIALGKCRYASKMF